MGVKQHSPLGGKRFLGEGVSWVHPCSWENLPCVEMILICFNGVWTSWLLAFLGGIKRCMKREDIVKPWKGMLLMGLCENMRFMDLKFSSWREPTFTLYLDSIVGSMCKPLKGVYCVVLSCVVMVMHNMWMWRCAIICALFPKAWWVASLRPRMGGEPPWFPISSLFCRFYLIILEIWSSYNPFLYMGEEDTIVFVLNRGKLHLVMWSYYIVRVLPLFYFICQ
jgi:hypothetical protein